jgi:hypothetical protein
VDVDVDEPRQDETLADVEIGWSLVVQLHVEDPTVGDGEAAEGWWVGDHQSTAEGEGAVHGTMILQHCSRRGMILHRGQRWSRRREVAAAGGTRGG